jgi:hypothetical protein
MTQDRLNSNNGPVLQNHVSHSRPPCGAMAVLIAIPRSPRKRKDMVEVAEPKVRKRRRDDDDDDDDPELSSTNRRWVNRPRVPFRFLDLPAGKPSVLSTCGFTDNYD